MKSAAHKSVPDSKSLVTETGKYALATAEYTGLLTASYAVRSGNLLKATANRLADPVKKLPLSAPLQYCKKTASRIGSLTSAGVKSLGKLVPSFGAEPLVFDSERLARIEEMLMQIDRRLAAMERGGTVYRSRAVTQEKAKLDKAKSMLLHQLVEANKQLKKA